MTDDRYDEGPPSVRGGLPALSDVALARVLGDRHPIGVLADRIDDACRDLDIVVGDSHGRTASVGLAAYLLVGGLIPLPTATKWASLVEPGDVIDGRVVTRVRAGITALHGAFVDVHTALPRATSSILDAAWADERVDRHEAKDLLTVVEGLWPRRPD